MGTINEIFKEHGPEYLERYGNTMPAGHKKVINAIIACKTEVFGTCVYQCDDCKATHFVPLSCGNRHCPNCQHHKTQKWIIKQRQAQLPGIHFMITFTVPEQIRRFIRSHQKSAYSALFAASSQALKKLSADPRHVGGDLPGFYGVLHTWGRQMQYHPHIHYVVAGCTLLKKDLAVFQAKDNFYVPVKPLGIIYKAKFIALMKKEGLYDQIPASAWKPYWNVNCQAVGEESEHATQYLANYVFKVAVSDNRVTTDNQTVFLSYKKQKSNRPRTMKLDPLEFLRRFLQHVLPKGFMKIRYYGFMHPSCSVALTKVKEVIAKAIGLKVAPETCKPKPLSEPVCSHCGGVLIFRFFVPPEPLLMTGVPAG